MTLLGTSAQASAKRSIPSLIWGGGGGAGRREAESCWSRPRGTSLPENELLSRKVELRGGRNQTNIA